MTVSMLYRESLNNLMNMLHLTHPHFIRCIIPNEKKTSGLIEAGLVLNQLTCNGVLEGIRICRKGFPNRMVHADYRHRYSVLAADEASSSTDPKKCAEAILAKLVKNGTLTEENFRMGATKVFFKAGVLAHLEDVRDEVLKEIMTKLQAYIRWYLGLIDRKRRIQQRAGLLVVQRNVRQWLSLRTWEWFKIFTKVRPMLREGKLAEEMEKITERLKELEETLNREGKLKAELQSNTAKMESEKNEMFAQLEQIRAKLAEMEERVQKETEYKSEVDRKLEVINVCSYLR
ncbi:unnamed protein product [Toxocara canis]|uniref:Myosin motor domain-containing protein n=1 Tax=Toxocara canis TaxID=6265 RepID=A0A183U7L4_TOXCA|nr:unnamed protein product [Toxocara canis]